MTKEELVFALRKYDDDAEISVVVLGARRLVREVTADQDGVMLLANTLLTNQERKS